MGERHKQTDKQITPNGRLKEKGLCNEEFGWSTALSAVHCSFESWEEDVFVDIRKLLTIQSL